MLNHHIDTGSKKPIRQRYYRLPQAQLTIVKQEIDRIERLKVIEPSRSEWASPIVLVPKKDGTTRFCADYRRLNRISRFDAYPMPRVDKIIDRLGGANYISKVDLTRGYWQVPLTEVSKEKTAFTTPFGLYHFNTMPFGLHGAPATFQRLMDQILRGTQDYAAAFMDDVVIYSRTWEMHPQHLREVLSRLREAGLTARPSKCRIAMREVNYLGHVVGGGKVKPDDTKVQAVREFPRPVTKTQLRSFIGLTGYYRKFIPDYATIATVLTDRTKKSYPNRLEWTEECEEAFTTLKTMLCSDLVLRSPDYSRPFLVQTDASQTGVGAVLGQVNEEGEEHPILYLSRKLLPREQSYGVTEKECLAVVWAVQALRVYLLGRQFKVQTDHQPLQWLDSMRDRNPRLTRWSLALQPYAFSVEHKRGRDNTNADSLSRIHQ